MGRIRFALRDCIARNVFLERLGCIPNTLRSIFLNSLCFSLHQDSTLNAFHGQALATALKLNDTVVDLNLAQNDGCGNEGAEACEPI